MCIADPSKESYRAMNLGRASWRNILFASPDYRRRRAEAGQAGCRSSLTGALQKPVPARVLLRKLVDAVGVGSRDDEPLPSRD